MTSKKPLLAVALVGVVLLSSVAAAGVASSTTAGEVGNDLAVAVENVGNDGATVTVTQNESAVANATVTAETVDNESYAGTGEYATGENGTVSLPEPDEDVTIEVTAAKGNATGSTTATLTAEESDRGEDRPFGQRVSSFVHEMLSAGDDGGPLGQMVSEFVTENNPGSASENRPDHAGPSDKTRENATEDDERGPPEHAGLHDDGETTDGDETTDDDGGDETDDEAEEDGGSQGPPDHAGNGNGNGNGH